MDEHDRNFLIIALYVMTVMHNNISFFKKKKKKKKK